MLPAWISGQLPLNDFSDDLLFRSLAPAQALSRKPLGFVDIGARGGVHDLVAPIAALTAVLGFEPDEQACAELNADTAHQAAWAQFRMLPVALSDKRGPAALHLCSAPTNHSLLPVNKAFIQRYNMVKFTQTGEFPLMTQTLDEVIFGELASETHWGEFLKIDTQGTEYEILQGAQRTLKERTVALFVEVEFCHIYEKQKLFSELELLLREQGFIFYGFHSTHERSCKQLDKRRFIGRERLLHADAVFFKDPLPGTYNVPQLTHRGEQALFVCAVVLGYFDFALELARRTFAPEKSELRDVTAWIEKVAYYDPVEARRAVELLVNEVRERPDHANVAAGRFVDQRRAICNFADVPISPY
jgi:FkbM family methyltransferase